MASQLNKLLSALISLCVIACMKVSVDGAPKVPCYFIFGDSLADSGNNNPLRTFAKANYPPYGIDFPNKTPTGRFCNGLTTADIIGQRLGFTNLIPPFALANGSTILQGVNYASASAGIREETGHHLGQNIGFDGQLNNHRAIVSRITALLKTKAAAEAHLRKCIYYVGLGSNDYINNYFLPDYPTSKHFNPDEYADALIVQYANQLVSLYLSGARKVAVFGVGLIGCTPEAMSTSKGGGCVKAMNNAAQIFNRELKSLVDRLNRKFKNARFIFVDIFEMGSADPRSFGFKVLNVGCCPVVKKLGLCDDHVNPCPNRKEYVFWDSFHPTEAMNQITANRSFTALNPSDAYPHDISRLAQLTL